MCSEWLFQIPLTICSQGTLQFLRLLGDVSVPLPLLVLKKKKRKEGEEEENKENKEKIRDEK